MLRERISPDLSEFLRYLAAHDEAESGLPTLNDLSRELGIGVAALREQLEVARALGLVEVKPRMGIRRKPYTQASPWAWDLALVKQPIWHLGSLIARITTNCHGTCSQASSQND